jgi:tRNA(fMet)-specific endonuclease VapC
MYLLDTNILSELIKRQPSPKLVSRLQQTPAESLFTASICVMELRLGSALRADHNFFWNRIEREILSRVQVLPFDRAAAEWAGDILSELKRVGKGIGLEDSMIGAMAMSHGYIVVTGNMRHFNRIPDLKVENWLV